MGLKLEPLVDYHADLRPPVEVGTGPFGMRRIFDVTGGHFEGPRLKGKLLPGGADWLLVGADGVGRLDVRATLATDDGAHIYLSYQGILVIDEKVAAALGSGAATQFGDVSFITQPRFETGDSRYTWLNAIVAVAEGRILSNAVEYRVYRVSNA